LGQFASGVAHEINNPLFVISGKASRILRKLEKGEAYSQDDLIKELTDIKETTKRIEDIVRNLKDISGRGGNCESKVQNVYQMVKKIVSLTHERLRVHDIDLRIDVPEDLELVCNSVQVSQVLMNLINNSYQAIEKSPQDKWIQISSDIKKDKLCLCVTDSGNGINPDVQLEMMNPFFTTKEIGEGTGLGLSISSTIMQNHNGRLIFDDKSPNTKFIMEFPLLA
ncbi:MAG: GHKL domain-containing protein, partial [Deltaproteobacteria bacterium]